MTALSAGLLAVVVEYRPFGSTTKVSPLRLMFGSLVTLFQIEYCVIGSYQRFMQKASLNVSLGYVT